MARLMPAHSQFNMELGKTVEGLQQQLDAAVERSTELRESGASEDVVLTQTAVAFRTAKALELLTGVSWDSRLLDETPAAGAESEAPAPATAPVAEARRHRRGLLRRARTA